MVPSLRLASRPWSPAQERLHRPKFLSSEYPASSRESKKAFQFELNISGAEYPLGTHSSSPLFSPPHFPGLPHPLLSIPFGILASLKDDQASALCQFLARILSSFFCVSSVHPRSQEAVVTALGET